MIGENEIVTSRGVTMWWEDNGVGGRRYYSDEVGCGVLVWDTSLVDSESLFAAIRQEMKFRTEETGEEHEK